MKIKVAPLGIRTQSIKKESCTSTVEKSRYLLTHGALCLAKALDIPYLSTS